jgi:hypothetical protein
MSGSISEIRGILMSSDIKPNGEVVSIPESAWGRALVGFGTAAMAVGFFMPVGVDAPSGVGFDQVANIDLMSIRESSVFADGAMLISGNVLLAGARI